MVKDCEVSLTLGGMGCFHFLASGKSIKKITSGWEWRQLTGKKLQGKMKGGNGAAPAAQSNTSVMHSSQIFVITCPSLLHNSIKDTLTYGGKVLQQLWGNKKIPGQAGEWEQWCVEPHKPRQGSESPVGRFSMSMATLSLCTQWVYLLWTILEREHFQKHLLWSQQSLPAPGCSIPQYF